jgi:N-acetylglutamate synthase-like GNAT family acetyltransferase
MPLVFERNRDQFTISTDPSRLDVDAITDMLSRSYWADKRTREQLEHALSNSLVFGLFDGSRQIGLARIISDFAIFAYLCDVIIHEEYRGQGLGKWLMETVHSHPGLQGLRRWFLATRDAHGLYSKYGWTPLNTPERWMEKFSG